MPTYQAITRLRAPTPRRGARQRKRSTSQAYACSARLPVPSPRSRNAARARRLFCSTRGRTPSRRLRLSRPLATGRLCASSRITRARAPRATNRVVSCRRYASRLTSATPNRSFPCDYQSQRDPRRPAPTCQRRAAPEARLPCAAASPLARLAIVSSRHRAAVPPRLPGAALSPPVRLTLSPLNCGRINPCQRSRLRSSSLRETGLADEPTRVQRMSPRPDYPSQRDAWHPRATDIPNLDGAKLTAPTSPC